MGRFTNPRDLYFGEGARHEVKNLKGSKAIIVTGGGSMRRGGFLQDVEADLKEGGFEVKLFEGVESDPSIETVMKGAEAMREFEPDWIIAIGGGSPIDAAKAMWVFYEYPEESFDNIIQPFSFPELRQKAKFCAISSTSGTATEVTAFSVITDYAKGIKYPLADFNITPDVAIVDPELTYTMPAKLCAHTGMDALTHCMEAYVSTFASMFTDANALHGIREIVEWLPKSYEGDKEARQHMHEAQCIAGIAFSSGLLGIVHSMAHKTGAAFENGHIIHGAANAMYLGKVIQWNSKDPRAAERYAFVAGGPAPSRRDQRGARCRSRPEDPRYERRPQHPAVHQGLRERWREGRRREPADGFRGGVPRQAARDRRERRDRRLHAREPA